jgi:hypothetical protein
MKQRGNRYSTAYVTRARELYGAGWTNCTEIARILEREMGRRPGQTTIRRWVDPDYAEVVRTRQRRGGVCGPARTNTWRLRLARIMDLQGIGLTYDAIARVVSHDFELELDEDQVGFLLRGEASDEGAGRLLWPEGAQS